MGLSASQARLLGLTARKSNLEYQAQQINQQRTALSNEVMGLNENYNELKVPVPPSSTDYVETVYSFGSSDSEYKVTGYSKILSGDYAGKYNVTIGYTKSIPKGYMTSYESNIVATKNEKGDDYSKLSFEVNGTTYTYEEGGASNTITRITENYDNYTGLRTIMNDYNLEDGTEFYMYNYNGVNYYTTKQDLDDTFKAQEELKYYGPYSYYYQGNYKSDTTAQAIGELTTSSSGTLSSITVIECEDLPELKGKTYSITVESEPDKTAYTNAMNQYTYEKQTYENEVEKLNLKTEQIQQQDRTLELKLNQIDTEQESVKTEIESVQQVIKDTIDSVFKTFDQ